jgi:hypothetical protein
MSSPLSADRLDQLVLARLAARPAPGPARLREAVRRFWPAASPDDIEGALRRLEGAGSIARGRRSAWQVTELGAGAARQLGAGTPWKQVADAVLPIFALGWGADDKQVRKRLDGRELWAAAIVARDFGLIGDGEQPPTPSFVSTSIVWRMLGLNGELPRQLPAVMPARFIGALLGAEVADWRRGLVLLAGRSVAAPRADVKALRDGVVQAWLGGHSWTEATQQLSPVLDPGKAPARDGARDGGNGPARESSPPPVNDLEAFAGRVREAARQADRGVFGDRKVFISSVWRGLYAGDDSVSLEEFKRHLIEANRLGLLRLYRADLVEEMDPAEVAASATQYRDATFHFVEREATP